MRKSVRVPTKTSAAGGGSTGASAPFPQGQDAETGLSETAWKKPDADQTAGVRSLAQDGSFRSVLCRRLQCGSNCVKDRPYRYNIDAVLLLQHADRARRDKNAAEAEPLRFTDALVGI